MRRFAPVVSLSLLLSGCAYYNSLYNANRLFADAERVRPLQEDSARAAYRASIDRATHSYTKYPRSRWADDALLLIGRAHFALGEDEAAAAALTTALESTTDAAITRLAHAYLGAVLVRLDRADAARPHLDLAAAAFVTESEHGAFTRLWRARAAFQQGRIADGWADLDALAHDGDRVTAPVALEQAIHALALDDTVRLTAAFGRLAAARVAPALVSAVERLLEDGARRWSAAHMIRVSTPLENAAWNVAAQQRVTMSRARIAAAARDTASAIALAARVATAGRGTVAGVARVTIARWRLAGLDDVADLESLRELLAPAVDDTAVTLQRAVRATQILIARGTTGGTPLALFAAAELARDELHAPALARRLFLDFVGLLPDEPWSGKALIAAHVLRSDADTDAALATRADNVYLRAARGEDTGEAYTLAEQRMTRGLTGLRAEAIAQAGAADVGVSRTVSVVDSAASRAVRPDTLQHPAP